MNRSMGGMFVGIWLLGMSSTVFCEETVVVRDRGSEVQNEALRQAVAADRDAAQKAHEQEMLKLRQQDAERLAGQADMKQRYREVQANRQQIQNSKPHERERLLEQQQQKRNDKEVSKQGQKSKN